MDKPTTILIVDDEPSLRLGLAAKIKRRGYEVVTAADGREGIQKARITQPDLILSDVMMPPPNGFEMRRLMGQDPKLASIPFIFLTARNGIEDRVAGIRDGADDYVTKPFVTEELLARIEAVLRRVQVEQARGREQAQASAREDMDRLKQGILQNFHHEMRTPLTNIILPLELVVTKKYETPEEQSRFIRIALSNVDRLESLVTDFIFLTSMDQGNLNHIRQPVEVETHILAPVQKRLQRYASKELNLVPHIKVAGRITAPRQEFIHSVLHLADNAFKFSPDRGTVHMGVEASGNGGVVVTIHDEGPGVPLNLREKVFERYYQISQGDTRNFDGLGVGLTIAKAVFENSRGSVSFLNMPRGCCLQAILPDERPEDIVYG